MMDEDDMQQSYLMDKIGQRMPTIEAADVPMEALIHQAYEVGPRSYATTTVAGDRLTDAQRHPVRSFTVMDWAQYPPTHP